MKYRVLFLCETNLYGPIAAALLRWIDSEHFTATSAGVVPGRLHPLTMDLLKEIGIDLVEKTPVSVKQLREELEFDYVISLGESVPSHGRNFPRAQVVHWTFAAPGELSDDRDKQLRSFRMVRDQILRRLRLFVLVHVPSQMPAQPAALSMAASS